MMSLSTISGDSSYYGGKENFEIIQEDKGEWHGKGAELLQLNGKIEPAQLDAMLKGHLPDGANLKTTQHGKETNRPGLDLTFGAPKSVSILALMGGDARLQEAFKLSVKETLDIVEQSVNCRQTVNGETTLTNTGNGIFALYTHDTNRNGEMHLHTHALMLNATHDGEKWRALGSDLHNHGGIRETLYDLQINFGRTQGILLRQKVEALGYETVSSGKNGLWEIKDVPREVIDAYSTRTQEIREQAGEDASAKSREIAALDTREKKELVNGETRLAEWWQKLDGHTFDPVKVVQEKQANPEPVTQNQEANQAQLSEAAENAVRGAIVELSDKRPQFSFDMILTAAARELNAQGIESPAFHKELKAQIELATESGQLIPLDAQKGIFTSTIHQDNEAQLRAAAGDALAMPKAAKGHGADGVKIAEQKGVYRELVAERAPVSIVSGAGGVAVQSDRIEKLADAATAQGREPIIVAGNQKQLAYLQNRHEGANVLDRKALMDSASLNAFSTIIVKDADSLKLSEAQQVLELSNKAGAQVIFLDGKKFNVPGNALQVMRDEGVSSREFNDHVKPSLSIHSEQDEDKRYAAVAEAYMAARDAGETPRVQVNRQPKQLKMTAAIRDKLRERGELTGESIVMDTLTRVYLDDKARATISSYKPGMKLERYNPETRSKELFTIANVGEKTRALQLVDSDGKKSGLKVSAIDNSYDLLQPGKIEIQKGEQLVLTENHRNEGLKRGDVVTFTGTDKKGRLLMANIRGEFKHNPDKPLRMGYNYVESVGKSYAERGTVIAALTQQELRAETVNRMAEGGNKLQIFTAANEDKAVSKLGRLTSVKMISEQISAFDGHTLTTEQTAITIALTNLGNEKLIFDPVDALNAAIDIKPGNIQAMREEVNAQIKNGDLIQVQGMGGMVTSRLNYENEKSIIGNILQGKESVTPLMQNVPDSLTEGLTKGQANSTRLILETPDRFVGVQGYAGVGKTHQFKAVMAAINTLPEDKRPEIIGLAPTRRAVAEMQSAGVNTETVANFLHEQRKQIAAGETLDYSNRLFLLDEASMVSNKDMADVYQLIADNNGRAVTVGDEAQLSSIDIGQAFRLMQERSAMDVQIMDEIVRQKPELREMVYKMIEQNAPKAIELINAQDNYRVPRHADAFTPETGIHVVPEADREACEKLAADGKPTSVIESAAQDFTGRTKNARDHTLVIASLNSDRREINRSIQEKLLSRGEIENPQPVRILENITVKDSQKRTMRFWSENIGNTVLINREYYTITGIDDKAEVAILTNQKGEQSLVSPFQNSTEQPQFFRSRDIQLAEGDKVRYTLNNNENGTTNNATGRVVSIKDNILTVESMDGRTTKKHDLKEMENRHFDLGYCVTVHSAQGASEEFAIGVLGTLGGRKLMLTPELFYVSGSRHKQHVQFHFDSSPENIANQLAKVKPAKTASDILERAEDRLAMRAKAIERISSPATERALGKNILFQLQLDGEKTMARFVPGTRKHPAPSLAFPVFDDNGRKRGLLMQELSTHGHRTESLELVGASTARFIAIQKSSDKTVMIVDSLPAGIKAASENPESGVLVRWNGEGKPANLTRVIGGCKLVDVPDSSSLPKEFADTRTPAEVLRDLAVRPEIPTQNAQEALREAQTIASALAKANVENALSERIAHEKPVPDITREVIRNEIQQNQKIIPTKEKVINLTKGLEKGIED